VIHFFKKFFSIILNFKNDLFFFFLGKKKKPQRPTHPQPLCPPKDTHLKVSKKKITCQVDKLSTSYPQAKMKNLKFFIFFAPPENIIKNKQLRGAKKK
jgi:hypothetical protein